MEYGIDIYTPSKITALVKVVGNESENVINVKREIREILGKTMSGTGKIDISLLPGTHDPNINE